MTLRPEISIRGSAGPVLLETLAVAAGWPSWEALRTYAGYSADASEGLMASALIHLLVNRLGILFDGRLDPTRQ